MLKLGVAREIITPEQGVSLAGYFNARPNVGVYDDLYVRAAAFEQDGTYSGIISYDVCTPTQELFDRLFGALAAAGLPQPQNWIVCADHTHTGLTQYDNEKGNTIDPIVEKAVLAAKRAFKNMQEGHFSYAKGDENPCGFVRRFWMKNGTVVTNPGKLNPNIVKPETDFDRQIKVVGLYQGETLVGVMVNLAQHGDTIGGNMVSADWMGRMERYIQNALEVDIPVFSIMHASGNINHFDVSTDRDQTNYGEAKRIGRIYADEVLKIMKNFEVVPEGKLAVKTSTFKYLSRVVSKEDYEKAKQTMIDIPEDVKSSGDLTSEGLASGDPWVLRHFAKRIVDCVEKSIPYRTAKTTAIEFGDELAFISLPGEPFNGIGAGVLEKAPFKRALIVELAQSRVGYTPMGYCFERGGYETMPAVNSADVTCADTMIKAALDNL